MGLPLLNALRWSSKADKVKSQNTMSAKNQVLLAKIYAHVTGENANTEKRAKVLETRADPNNMNVFERGNDSIDVLDADEPNSGMLVRPAQFPNPHTLNLNAMTAANEMDSDIFTPGSLLNPYPEIINDVESINDESFENIGIESSKRDDDDLPLAFVKLQLNTKLAHQHLFMPTHSWSRRAISYDQLYYAVHARRSHESDGSDGSLTDELYIDSNYNLEFRSERYKQTSGHFRSQSMQSPELIYSTAKQGKPVHVQLDGYTAERLEFA
ncbi:hypothetical protein VKS41_007325 [Umbelopsis sp. WA50703]|jgi:hypothetical protein